MLSLVALAIFWLMLVLIARHGRSLTDSVTLFVLVLGFFYGLRASILAFHLDHPFPDYLFYSENSDAILAKSIAFIALFLLGALFGLNVAMTLPSKPRTVLFVSRRPPLRRMVAASTVLTAVGLLATGYLLVRSGGFSAMVRDAKIDKTLAGSYVLQLPVTVGAVCSAATWIDCRRRSPGERPRRLVSTLMLVFAFADALAVFAWGQRSAVTVVLAMLVLSARPDPAAELPVSERADQRARASGLRGGQIGRLVVGVVLVLGAAAFLRVVRDISLSGQASSGYAEGNFWRKITLGANANYLDASMLATRDFPSQHSFRGFTDFIIGVEGIVPRVFWPGKPVAVNIGPWFRQLYEPTAVNGWPVGAPLTWYLAFGVVGLLLGGILSGAVVGRIALKQRQASDSGINVGIAIVIAVFAFQLGWSTDMPFRVATSLVPFLPLVWWLGRTPRPAATTRVTRRAVRPTTQSKPPAVLR